MSSNTFTARSTPTPGPPATGLRRWGGNVWHSDRIARISPITGKVLGWIDLTGLLPQSARSSEEAVLNGIAYDAAHDRLFVTGKLWPRLFEIKVVSEREKDRAKLVLVEHRK